MCCIFYSNATFPQTFPQPPTPHTLHAHAIPTPHQNTPPGLRRATQTASWRASRIFYKTVPEGDTQTWTAPSGIFLVLLNTIRTFLTIRTFQTFQVSVTPKLDLPQLLIPLVVCPTFQTFQNESIMLGPSPGFFGFHSIL